MCIHPLDALQIIDIDFNAEDKTTNKAVVKFLCNHCKEITKRPFYWEVRHVGK